MSSDFESDYDLSKIPDSDVELPPEVYAFIRAIELISQGQLDICPRCGAKLTSLRQSLRSVYGSCGCRLYQGRVPEKYRE